MNKMFDETSTYTFLASLVMEAPTLRFAFKMRPEVAFVRGVRREGCDYVRVIDLKNGNWVIVGVLESEANDGDPARVFLTIFRSRQEMQKGMDAVMQCLITGTMSELLA
ncbi:hypothetical protein [Geothrix paludis]|uniref:hypothetical protein n=1 Tax=Geothrix paludis TaxID=2922722 RepID=UPI001FAC7B25|nr:hypothetical protein [Geothrix paludis]